MLLKCASYNVNELRKNPKRKSIFYFLKQKIMILYFFKKPILVLMMKSFGNTNGEVIFFFSHGENNSKGVAILIKHLLKIDFGNVNIDPTGRYCFNAIIVRG